ncbi:MAG: potassium transporter TrkA [Deltaproteobacteria bacterium]|nr:potassium transporter TrkA [Deltaproteobacteria bacterium]
MATRETDLPGVGTKYSLDVGKDEQLVVVHHRVGHWELARVDAEGKVSPLVQLQAREATELGRILSRGEVLQEDPRKRMLFEEFGIEWVKLEPESSLVGLSLEESGIRARTGASVFAVLRPEGSIPSPSPVTRFANGDTLVLIGHPDQIERFLSAFTSLSSDK